jgi:hypothetical protein
MANKAPLYNEEDKNSGMAKYLKSRGLHDRNMKETAKRKEMEAPVPFFNMVAAVKKGK